MNRKESIWRYSNGCNFINFIVVYVLMSSTHREEIVADDLLGLAVEFAATKHFQGAIDKFIADNVEAFQAVSDSKMPDNDELPHTYNELFMDYQQLIDDLFEEFSRKEMFSTKQLYDCFRDAGTAL